MRNPRICAFAWMICCLLILSIPSMGDVIDYQVQIGLVGVTLGGVSLPCTDRVSFTDCAGVAIDFVANTNDVTPFSVTGASGFQILNGTARLAVLQTGTLNEWLANFLPGQISLAVDQTNNGVGFGSMYGPAYPLGTYGPAAYGSYDLRTAFPFTAGFSPFCTDVAVCQNGAPLQTDVGDFVITFPFAPDRSWFEAYVISTPEPGSLSLLAFGFCGLGLFRRKQLS